MTPRVAVIGSGVAGLGAAYRLRDAGAATQVTLFEAADWFGGHAHTVDVMLQGQRFGVDTGFLVFNDRTYPQLIRLFAELGVSVAESDMSFSVQAGELEWSGCDLNTVFAQRRNLLKPRFLKMLADLLRFNALTTRLALSQQDAALRQPLQDFLDEHRFGTAFRDWYLLPMLGCIWSCPTDQMLRFPVATMIRFCHNHGLIQVANRPQWRTVRGGSRTYVQRMLQRIGDARLNAPVLGLVRREHDVVLRTAAAEERFDAVVFACHPDQALRILGSEATVQEREVLGAIRYQPNRAVLHTDATLLPRKRLAWAAWNYERADDADRERTSVCLHYLINRLQPLPVQQPVIVSLNPLREPRADCVIQSFNYDHPVFDQAAIDAQTRVPQLQGRQHSWYCGAWTGYGFHEDGLTSGLAVADALMQRLAGSGVQSQTHVGSQPRRAWRAVA